MDDNMQDKPQESAFRQPALSHEEAVYQSVINCVNDNNLGVLSVKINNLKSIIEYKNARELLENCYRKQRAVKRKMVRQAIMSKVLLVLDIAMILFVAVLCIWLVRK